MVTASFYGPMDVCTEVNGKMANNMAKASTSPSKATKDSENGGMESATNGWRENKWNSNDPN